MAQTCDRPITHSVTQKCHESMGDEDLGEKSLFWIMPPEGGLTILEHLHANHCNSPRRPYVFMRHEIAKKAVFFRPRCKLWSCPSCAAVNAQKARFQAIFGARALMAQDYKLDFVTLTSHERLTPAQSIRVYPNAWKKLSMRVRRRADVEYFAVPEQHKDGRLHMHMMFAYANRDERLPKKFWKDAARSCGMGYQVDVETMKEASHAGVYVTKYMHKSLEETLWPKGFRRFRTSMLWPEPPALDPDQMGWVMGKLADYKSLKISIDALTAQSYQVIMCDERDLGQIVDLGYRGV